MVDVSHNDGLKIKIFKILSWFFVPYFRVCDHDNDCGAGDTSDEDANCGKWFWCLI